MANAPKWPVYQVANADGTVNNVGKSPKWPVIQIADANGNLISLNSANTYNVQDYGAKGDGVTDDTAAINTTITTAVNAAVSGATYYAEVYFPPGVYVLGGALQQGGTTFGNAQIPLPIIAPTAHKVTLVLRGVKDAGALPHWQQTISQKAGTVLKSTLTGQVYSATYSLPSIVGGPTPEQGYGTTGALFNNMLIVVDGIELQAPANPSVCGFDFRGMAEANIINGAAQADQIPGTAALPTNFNTGLMMPVNGNNAYCDINQWSCEGWYCGVALGEHSNATSIRSVYCNSAIRILGPNPHSIYVGYACVESCKLMLEYVDISPVAFSANGAYVVVDLLDVERGSSPFNITSEIADSGNKLFGIVNVATNNVPGQINVDGASHFRIIDISRNPGNVTAPSVPASTVNQLNSFWRDAAVTVSGGTVSAIKVDGVTTGITSGTVMVPPNKNISITYTVAPTWVWTLL